MRTFYDNETSLETPDVADARVTLFLQLAVLAFWTPCAGIDFYLLWRGWGGTGTTTFVFWLLFRQALVFLALWFTTALTHGLMVGRRTPPDERRRKRSGRRSGAGKRGSIATSRYNRGQ